MNLIFKISYSSLSNKLVFTYLKIHRLQTYFAKTKTWKHFRVVICFTFIQRNICRILFKEIRNYLYYKNWSVIKMYFIAKQEI